MHGLFTKAGERVCFQHNYSQYIHAIPFMCLSKSARYMPHNITWAPKYIKFQFLNARLSCPSHNIHALGTQSSLINTSEMFTLCIVYVCTWANKNSNIEISADQGCGVFKTRLPEIRESCYSCTLNNSVVSWPANMHYMGFLEVPFTVIPWKHL